MKILKKFKFIKEYKLIPQTLEILALENSSKSCTFCAVLPKTNGFLIEMWFE
jgi:hypothetical protein